MRLVDRSAEGAKVESSQTMSKSELNILQTVVSTDPLHRSVVHAAGPASRTRQKKLWSSLTAD
jgi:hypothetical protein